MKDLWKIQADGIELQDDFTWNDLLQMRETGQINGQTLVRPVNGLHAKPLEEWKQVQNEQSPEITNPFSLNQMVDEPAYPEQESFETEITDPLPWLQPSSDEKPPAPIKPLEEWEQAQDDHITEIPQQALPYEIKGIVSQYVEIDLQPGDQVMHEPGTLLAKDHYVQFDTKLGAKNNSGVFGALFQATKRSISGEKLWVSVLKTEKPAKIILASPLMGGIAAIDLTEKGEILCQKGLFLGSLGYTDVSIKIIKKITVGIMAEGFVLQKLNGQSTVFIAGGGTLVHKILDNDQKIDIETGSLAAFTSSCKYDFKIIRSMKSIMFGQEGVAFTQLTGPGEVWIQTAPETKLQAYIANIASQIISVETK